MRARGPRASIVQLITSAAKPAIYPSGVRSVLRRTDRAQSVGGRAGLPGRSDLAPLLHPASLSGTSPRISPLPTLMTKNSCAPFKSSGDYICRCSGGKYDCASDARTFKIIKGARSGGTARRSSSASAGPSTPLAGEMRKTLWGTRSSWQGRRTTCSCARRPRGRPPVRTSRGRGRRNRSDQPSRSNRPRKPSHPREAQQQTSLDYLLLWQRKLPFLPNPTSQHGRPLRLRRWSRT